MNIDISLRDFLDFVGFDVECDVYMVRSIGLPPSLLWSGCSDDIINYIDLIENEYKIAYIYIRDDRLQLAVVEV